MCEWITSIFRCFRFRDNSWFVSSHWVFGGFYFDEVFTEKGGYIVYNFEYFTCHAF